MADTSIDYDQVIESISTDVGTFTAENVWDAREADVAREANGKAEWDKLSDDQREVISEVVGKSLSEMQDRLSEWVPHSLEIERGRWLSIQFRLLFSDLEDEIRHQVAVSERRIKESAEDLREALEGSE